MPELPEVQIVVNHLALKLKGKIFCAGQILTKKMVSRNFAREIKNQKVKSVKRRGKMIIMELASGKFLLIHLKMTGQLIFVDKKGHPSGGGHPITSSDFNLSQVNKFTRLILELKDGSRLLFHDLRKFGWMKIVDQKGLALIDKKFGKEPLSKNFTSNYFKQLLKKRPNLKIKQFLMMQELIAGIGNIYADESLFKAKISPLRIIKSLKSKEIENLHSSIITILKKAIKLGGTSVNTFVHPTGKRGNFVAKLKVYQRGGKKCLGCGQILKKTKINGRGTVYCSKCQK
ncbi:bifunctional DNA-formamidopyrimidine glycosylase/DNA-(apurinic or apyrimidinic site) lyase [Patescibacteria group bacterium]|nr:bifunctional DNA-formamidopyrimidine glycosylase/DNA-(apurinic or apyrimidinic site) lyase [Patescibacteria group bacterium]